MDRRPLLSFFVLANLFSWIAWHLLPRLGSAGRRYAFLPIYISSVDWGHEPRSVMAVALFHGLLDIVMTSPVKRGVPAPAARRRCSCPVRVPIEGSTPITNFQG